MGKSIQKSIYCAFCCFCQSQYTGLCKLPTVDSTKNQNPGTSEAPEFRLPIRYNNAKSNKTFIYNGLRVRRYSFRHSFSHQNRAKTTALQTDFNMNAKKLQAQNNREKRETVWEKQSL